MFKINIQIKNIFFITNYWINIKLIKIAFFNSQVVLFKKFFDSHSKVLKHYFVSLLDRLYKSTRVCQLRL